jgi:3-deoxy-manno-octulosonate cytidylyltransferase (CMP-KDO synthetase)
MKKYDQFINVQGDMPDVTLQMIERCVEWLKYYPISTVWTDMPKEMQNNPDSVKMVRAGDQCLWFGRGMTGYGHWHLGIYGYKRNPLEFYRTMEVTQEEEVEKLEQLRWLKNGWQIGCSSVYFKGIEINSPEDVDIWHKQNSQ